MIPTQYAFLLTEEDGKYSVQVRAVTHPHNTTFQTKEEAMEFINQPEII